MLHSTHNEAQHTLGVTHQLNNLCYRTHMTDLPTHLPQIVLTLRSEISTWMAHQRGREGRGPLLVALVTQEQTRCQSPYKGRSPPIPTPTPALPQSIVQSREGWTLHVTYWASSCSFLTLFPRLSGHSEDVTFPATSGCPQWTRFSPSWTAVCCSLPLPCSGLGVHVCRGLCL